MLGDFLLENWTEFIGSPIPNSLDLVPITSCLEDYGNNIVLLFVDGGIRPGYVLKACRNQKYNFKLQNEYFGLLSLSNQENLESYLPTPYYMGKYDQCTFFIQSGIPGISLLNLIRTHGINAANHRLIKQAIQLIVNINRSVVESNLESQRVWMASSRNFFNDYENEFLEMGLSKPTLTEFAREYSRIERELKPLFIHGDFWQNNIMIENKNVSGIIDWEFCSPVSAISSDIIWFLINLSNCLYQRGKQNSSLFESYRWGFFQEGKHNNLFSSYFHEYLSGIGRNDELKLLLKMTLAEMSMRELISYGRHMQIDRICQDMLMFTIKNDEKIQIR